MRTLAAVALVSTALTAVGCVTTSAPTQTVFSAPHANDGGVVIAESFMVPGTTTATDNSGTTDDCAGPGLGIRVDSSTSGGNFLYDKNGEPCEAAQTVFNGSSALGSRAADPSIALSFYDQTGPIPDTLETADALPSVRVTSKLYKTTRRQGVGAPAGDPLLATLTKWQRQDTTTVTRIDEADAAAARNLDNIAKNARDDEEGKAQLMAKLRERERQVEEERIRNEATLERSQANRATTSAAQTAWQQKENELQAELDATRQRLAQFQQLNQRLTAEKSAKEQAYQNRISSLSADLKAAEIQSDNSRRELVMQAAAKIAEAEQLAHAAQIQEQDARLREAARLKQEAQTMMDRALAIKAGQGVVVQGVGAPEAAPMALLQTPVVVHARQQTLSAILDDLLTQARPQAGKWQADWQLSAGAQRLLSEKWSLTAEAPLQDVLSQLQQQVKVADGITLSFTQFNQSRLLVVTDAAATAK
jgi:hypothetical protein